MIPLWLLVSSAAGGAYLLAKKQTGATGAVGAAPKPLVKGPNTSQQPGQQYPWRANTPPRVDNSNQPWYAGPAQAVKGAAGLPNTGSMNDIAAGGSIVHSLADIWGTLAGDDGESADDPKANLTSTDSMPRMDPDPMEDSGWDASEYTESGDSTEGYSYSDESYSDWDWGDDGGWGGDNFS